jgi:hypothetical protein
MLPASRSFAAVSAPTRNPPAASRRTSATARRLRTRRRRAARWRARERFGPSGRGVVTRPRKYARNQNGCSRVREWMGIAVSLLLIALGAILAWAVNEEPSGLDLDAVGIILIVVGLVGFVLSLLWWQSWWGGGYLRRRATYADDPRYDYPPPERAGRRRVVEEEEVPAAGPPPPGPPP